MKDFIPYQEALALKELGFDESCIMQWTYAPELIFCTSTWGHPKLKTNKEIYSDSGGDCISAPTYSQAFRFFREKYNLRGFIGFRPNVKQFDCHVYDMSLSGEEYAKQRTIEEFNKDPKVGTYEEAELACLKKLIEIVKNKQHE